MRVAALGFLWLVACHREPLDLTVFVEDSRGDESLLLTWSIDGQTRLPPEASMTLHLPDGLDRPLLLESWYGDVRLDFKEIEMTCGGSPCGASTCLFGSGQLGMLSMSCGSCIGDGFCATECGCTDEQKCAFVVTVEEPLLGHRRCVPDGDVPPDGECVRGAAGLETGYDNCTDAGVCIDGLCVRECNPAVGGCRAGERCQALEPHGNVCLPR